jgi:hypothetical protein
MRPLARNCRERDIRRFRIAQRWRRETQENLRKIGLLAAIPMKPSATGRLFGVEGAAGHFASGLNAHPAFLKRSEADATSALP